MLLWSLGGYLFRIHGWSPSTDYRTLDFGFQCFWLDFKDLVPEFLDVDVIHAMGSLVGHIQAIVPEDANPTGSNVVGVYFKIDHKKLLIVIDHVEADCDANSVALNERALTIFKFGTHGVAVAPYDGH